MRSAGNRDERETAVEEAAGWVARLQSSDATEEDRRAFARWCARHPANEGIYAELSALWGDLKDVPIPPERLGRLQRARRMAAGGGIVALLAVAVLSYGVVNFGYLDRWQADHYTVIGEVRTLMLEDGTRVDLNTDSAIAVRYDDGRRRVSLLRGEAFFDVVPNPARPFVVEGDAVEARAVGTRYAVRVSSGDFGGGVQVEEGTVAVSTPNDAALVEAGSDAVVTEGGNLVVSATDVSSLTAWREGKLVFSGRPLGEVLETLERYRFGRIIVMDDGAARQTVSGVFDLNDTDAALDGLSRSLPVSVTRLTNMMVIVRSR